MLNFFMCFDRILWRYIGSLLINYNSILLHQFKYFYFVIINFSIDWKYFRPSRKRAREIKNRTRLWLAFGSYEDALWSIHLLSFTASCGLCQSWGSLVRERFSFLPEINKKFLHIFLYIKLKFYLYIYIYICVCMCACI